MLILISLALASATHAQPGRIHPGPDGELYDCHALFTGYVLAKHEEQLLLDQLVAAYKAWKDRTVRDSELGLPVATRDAGIRALVNMDEQYIPRLRSRLAEAAEYSKKLEDAVSACAPGPF